MPRDHHVQANVPSFYASFEFLLSFAIVMVDDMRYGSEQKNVPQVS